MLYSKKTGLIYHETSTKIPEDAIVITESEFNFYNRYVDGFEGLRIISGVYPFETEEYQKDESEEIAKIAQSLMIAELNWCDLQVKLHNSSDKRAISSLDEIYRYSRECRDYVRLIDGTLEISGKEPVRPK